MSEHIGAAIVDYGMGNVFSVRQACVAAGMTAAITNRPVDLDAADVVIIPGVGAFGDAMTSLTKDGLTAPLRRAVERGAVVVGVCLGMQLLLAFSEEFGEHRGLDIIPGRARWLPRNRMGSAWKVPQVGWSRVEATGVNHWVSDALSGTAWYYFTHSLYAETDRDDLTIGRASGCFPYAAVIGMGDVVGFQFHPERSGPDGLAIYDAVRRRAHEKRAER